MLKLLEDICVSQGNSQQTKDSDGDRVTQGLGTVWSLILARPPLRQDCLDIALKVCIFFSFLTGRSYHKSFWVINFFFDIFSHSNVTKRVRQLELNLLLLFTLEAFWWCVYGSYFCLYVCCNPRLNIFMADMFTYFCELRTMLIWVYYVSMFTYHVSCIMNLQCAIHSQDEVRGKAVRLVCRIIASMLMFC